MHKVEFKPIIFDAIKKYFFLSCEEAIYHYRNKKSPKDENEFKTIVLDYFIMRMKSMEQRVSQYERESFRYTLNSFLNDLNNGKQDLINKINSSYEKVVTQTG